MNFLIRPILQGEFVRGGLIGRKGCGEAEDPGDLRDEGELPKVVLCKTLAPSFRKNRSNIPD